jgi:hypothetical protein
MRYPLFFLALAVTIPASLADDMKMPQRTPQPGAGCKYGASNRAGGGLAQEAPCNATLYS